MRGKCVEMDFYDNLSLKMNIAVGEASPLSLKQPLKWFGLLVSCWFGAFPAVLLEISINTITNISPHCIL